MLFFLVRVDVSTVVTTEGEVVGIISNAKVYPGDVITVKVGTVVEEPSNTDDPIQDANLDQQDNSGSVE